MKSCPFAGLFPFLGHLFDVVTVMVTDRVKPTRKRIIATKEATAEMMLAALAVDAFAILRDFLRLVEATCEG